MLTAFPGVPEAVGEVWKADWYVPHCYKIPALAQLNHLLAQIPRAPTRNDVWLAGTGPADLRRFHRDLGEVLSEAELAQKQLGIFLQAVQTTAAGLQKEIGKRLSAENPSGFRKWFQKFPGAEEPLLAGAVSGGGAGYGGGSHSRSNSTSSGGAGSGGSGGNAAGGKMTDGSNGSSPANKVSSDSPGDESAPSQQPSKVSLANRMRSKSMNVASSGSLFRSPDDSVAAKLLGSEISPMFASAGLDTNTSSSGAGSAGGGSAARKMFTRAFSVRERPSAVSAGDVERALNTPGGGGNSGGNSGGGGGFLDACGFSPVLLRARNAGRVGPMGEGEVGDDGASTPVLGRGGGNGGLGGGNGGGGGGAAPAGVGSDTAAFPGIAVNHAQQQQPAPQCPASPRQPPHQAASERHSGPLLQGMVDASDSHADVALQGPGEREPSAKLSGSSKGGLGGFLFRSRSSRSSSHRRTFSQQQQLQGQVAEEGEEEEEGEGEREGDEVEEGIGRLGVVSEQGVGGSRSRRLAAGPRLTKSRSEKAPSSRGGGMRSGARAGKSGHERLQEILSSVSSGWGGLPLSSPLSGSSISSGGSSLRSGSMVVRSATVSGTESAAGGALGRAGGGSGSSVARSASGGTTVSGSGGLSPRGTGSSAFSHFPQAHRLSLASHSPESSFGGDVTPPYGGSDRGGAQAEGGREQEGVDAAGESLGGRRQGSRVLLSPAKAAQEEMLLEMLRSTPPIRWDKPGQARGSAGQLGT
ncbi:hypothetical protein CLOP_g18646 [Closterium sp. NIES-67]|nr:hypothetical protein CLOP_g18646 [Closterium sp. NIES-67]